MKCELCERKMLEPVKYKEIVDYPKFAGCSSIIILQEKSSGMKQAKLCNECFREFLIRAYNALK